MTKHRSTTEDHRFASLKQRLTGWLMAEGFNVREDHHPSAHWVLACQDEVGRALVVVQPTGRTDSVEIQATIVPVDVHRQAIASLPAPERDELIWDLRFRLLSMGVDHLGIDHPMEQVTLVRRVFTDGLGRREFTEAITRMRHGVIAVVWSIVRKLGQPIPPSDIPEHVGIN